MKKFALIFLLCLFSVTAKAQLSETSRAEFSEFNILGNYNPGFESGKAKWTATGGTFAYTSTAANVFKGVGAASWDSSASAQYFQSSLVAVPAGLKGNSCIASIQYLWDAGTSADLKLQAYDGTNVLAEVELTKTEGYFREAFAAFVCPTSGSIRLRVASTVSNPAIIYVDHAYLGGNYKLSNISQAEIIGSSKWSSATNCTWISSSASYADYAGDGDCPLPTLTGSATSAAQIPKITFATLQPGKYEVVFQANTTAPAASSDCYWAIYDGSTRSGLHYVYQPDAAYQSTTLTGYFTYTTAQTNKVFSLQLKLVGGTDCRIQNSQTGEYMEATVKRYPLDSQKAVTLDTQGWLIDANIGSGSSNSFDISTNSSYVEMTEGTMDLVTNSGSQSVQIACASGTASSGSTCTAANESNGIAFSIPRAGWYRACVSGSSYQSAVGANNSAITYQIAETTNTSSSIVAEGNDRSSTTWTPSATALSTYPIHTCSNFYFASVGQKTLRLLYEASITSTTARFIADRTASVGQRDIHWTVIPLTNNFPQAVALTDIDPTKMTSGAAATRAGMKQYILGTPAGLSFSASPAGFSNYRSVFVPYQMLDGGWRMRFTVSGTFTSSATPDWTLSGVTFKNGFTNGQACAGYAGTSVTGTYGYVANNNGGFGLRYEAAQTSGSISCDVELNSKPTWAD